MFFCAISVADHTGHATAWKLNTIILPGAQTHALQTQPQAILKQVLYLLCCASKSCSLNASRGSALRDLA